MIHTKFLPTALLLVLVTGCGGGRGGNSTSPPDTTVNPTTGPETPLTVSESGLGPAVVAVDSVEVPEVLLGQWSRTLIGGDISCPQILTLTAQNTYSIKTGDSLIRGRFLYLNEGNSRRAGWSVYSVVHNGAADCFGNASPDTNNKGRYLALARDPDRLFIYQLRSGGSPSAIYDRGLPKPVEADEETKPEQSNFQLLTDMRAESGLTKEFALTQFAAFFGPLDEGPDLQKDASMPMFASHAIADLMEFKDEISDAVITQALQRVLGIDSSEGSKLGEPTHRQSRRADPALLAQAQRIVSELGSRLGVSLQSNIEAIRVNSILDLDIKGNGEPNVFAVPPGTRSGVVNRGIILNDIGLDSADSCWIVINEGTNDIRFDTFPAKTKEMALAHELMHCFQYELMSPDLPEWVMEGSAAWAGEAFVGGTGYYEDTAWSNYDEPLYGPFGGDPYAAIGLWSHADNSLNGNLFNWLPNIYSSGLLPSNMLLALFQQMGAEGYATWPSGGAGRPEWGPEWESKGVGGRVTKKIPAPATGSDFAPFGTSSLISLQRTSSAEESMILEIETDGIGLMHWSESGGSIEFGRSEPDQYCWSGDCLCDGQPVPGFETLVAAPETEDLIIAMTGKMDQTSSTFKSRFISVKELCPDTTGPVVQPIARDACLVGRWKLELQDLANQIKANLKEQDPDFNDSELGDLTGAVTIDYRADGTATGNADITLSGGTTEDDVQITTNVQGGGNFKWDTDKGRYIVTYTEELILTVTATATVGDITLPLNQTNELFTKEDIFGIAGDTGTTYSCSESNGTLRFIGEGAGSVSPSYTKVF